MNLSTNFLVTDTADRTKITHRSTLTSTSTADTTAACRRSKAVTQITAINRMEITRHPLVIHHSQTNTTTQPAADTKTTSKLKLK